MRIEAYNQISQIYKSGQAAKAVKAQEKESVRDEVQISSFGRDFQIAKQAVANAPDIREDKVVALREDINAGRYNVSVNDFAEKLLAGWSA